jgi:hypothetical protein
MDDVAQFRTRPVRLQQHIMRPAQGDKAAFDGQSAIFQAFRGPQALRGNCNDRRQRILHAMMQLLKQQTLQPLGHLVFRRINSGLSQEARGIDAGLGQQFAETRVLNFESVFLETFEVTRHGQLSLVRRGPAF